MRASLTSALGAPLLVTLSLGGLVALSLMTVYDVVAGSSVTRPGHADAGRRLFNGKGLCSYCHGVDGYRDRAPQLDADTAALIARLTPPPADLRKPNHLRLKTDQARATIIRDGHEGTGMFPDTTLSDEEIADIVAYLARLRLAGNQPPRERRTP
jgi:cytochrome c553